MRFHHGLIAFTSSFITTFACSRVPAPTHTREPVSIERDVKASDPAPACSDATCTTPVEQIPLVPGRCPADMVEVDGEYCPNERIVCLYNTDSNGKRLPGKGSLDKACGEYQNPSVCLSKTQHMDFCMDRYEWPNKEGQVPQDWMTYFDAKKATAAVGKRLCTAKEWTLAAEGKNMHPLPYGDGYHRDKTICNFDRHYTDIYGLPAYQALHLKGIDVFHAKRPNDPMSKAIRLFLVLSGSEPGCHSDFGVFDLSGNVDEFVVNEGGSTCVRKSTGNCISGLMGGHQWHVRNASRPMTTAHGETFGWYETSTRGCKDVAVVKE